MFTCIYFLAKKLSMVVSVICLRLGGGVSRLAVALRLRVREAHDLVGSVGMWFLVRLFVFVLGFSVSLRLRGFRRGSCWWCTSRFSVATRVL